MNRLDRFFQSRYVQHPPPPASPPDRGWEELRDLLQAVYDQEERERLPTAWVWWGGCLVALLLCGGVLWVVSRPVAVDDSLPTRSEHERVAADAPVADTTLTTVPIPSNVDLASHRTRSAELEVATKSASVSTSPTRLTTASLQETGASVDYGIEKRLLAASTLVPVRLLREPVSVVPFVRSTRLTPDHLVRRVVAGLDPIMVLAPLSGRRRAGRYTTVPTVVQEPKQRFERVPFDEPSPANWEVSARTLPWMITGYWSYDRLVSVQERIGQSARLFTQPDGPPLRLYDQGGTPGYNYVSDRELGLLMSSIEVARRTPAGFRFSLGMLYSQEGIEPDRAGQSLTQQLGPNEYLLIRKDGAWRSFWLSMGIQYTINRRRRFRVNVGLQALGQLAETYSREEYLVGGEPRETIFVSRVTTRSRGFFGWFLPLPQLTFEYRLQQNVALSLGVGGMSGVGATYGW